jgi:hypothetical protein
MRRIAVVTSFAVLATLLMPIFSAPVVAAPTITTCTDFAKNKTMVLKEDRENCRPFQAAAIWRVEQTDTSINSGDARATLKICSSQNPLFSYKFIKSKCPKFQTGTQYRRAVVKPQTPLVVSATANGHSGAVLHLALDTSTVANHAPIAYYLITNIKSNEITKVAPDVLNRLFISGLSPLTTYTFKISAVNIDGSSPLSLMTPEIRTTAVPVAKSSIAELEAPAFTLSSIEETNTVNNAITGYMISSTGGSIASYSISPAAPAGLAFSTSTGLLSGTPTSAAGATAYTVTATNASGSTTRTFTLTVTAIVYTVGQTGPGGGKIFYYNMGGFSCGVDLTLTCNYLEVSTSGNVRRLNWSSPALQNTSTPGSTGTAIGTGQKNTAVVVAAGASDSATSAIAFTDQYISSNGTSDWFLASKDEMTELSAANAANLLGGFILNPSDHYTSSQVVGTANQVWIDLTPGSTAWYKNYDAFIVPIRAG